MQPRQHGSIFRDGGKEAWLAETVTQSYCGPAPVLKMLADLPCKAMSFHSFLPCQVLLPACGMRENLEWLFHTDDLISLAHRDNSFNWNLTEMLSSILNQMEGKLHCWSSPWDLYKQKSSLIFFPSENNQTGKGSRGHYVDNLAGYQL